MWISGFHIDGFGLYHDQGALNLPNGLVLFTGENESGKTTLMEFIRTVLFGFPRKSKDWPHDYPPFRGGDHGGRLQVSMQDGRRFTIERLGRSAPTIISEGGGPEKAEPSQRLLGGIDRDTFRNIFAVGLRELQGLAVLSQEGVRGRLFAAGAGLGAASVPGAMKTVDDELARLLIPGGRTQVILQTGRRLKEIEAEIDRLQDMAAEYAQAHSQKERLEESIRESRREEGEIRLRLRRIEQLQQAREPWVRWRRAREQAQLLEFARDFPPDGLERFEALKREIDTLRQGIKARDAETARLALQLRELHLDEAVIARREAIEALLGERERLASTLKDYPIGKSRMGQAEEEFHRRLEELGPGWQAGRLAQVDTSVQVRQLVQEFGRRLAAAERRQETAQAYRRTLGEATENAQRAALEAESHWRQIPEPLIPEPRLQNQLESLRLMRPLLHRREVLNAQLQAHRAAKQDLVNRLAALERQLAEGSLLLPWWLGALPAVAGLALAGWLAWQRAYIAAPISFVVGAGLAVGFYLFRRRQAAAEARRRTGLAEERKALENQQKVVLETIDDLEEQIGGINQQLEGYAHGADLAPPQDPVALEGLAGELTQAAEALREWQTREQEKNKAAAQWRAAAEKLEKAVQEAEDASRELENLTAEWREWLTGRGFAEPVRPEGFEAVLQAVESARGAKRNLEEFRRQVTDMETYLAEVRGKIARVLEDCGRTPASGEIGVADLESLRHALSEALEIRQQQKNWQEKLAALASDLGQWQEQQREKEQELQSLAQSTGVADEEEFRRLAASYREWRDSVGKIDAGDEALLIIAGTPEARPLMEDELSRIDPLQLDAEKALLQARLEELLAASQKDNRQVGDLERQLTDMAGSEQLGELLLEQRRLQEQLADGVKRWGTLALCRHLLEQARGVYERERQPQVIQEAGRFLHLMAGGRYRLVASVGEAGLTLEDASLKRKEEISWSAGLADQVYLAVRLGLAREFGRHSEPLPVILDDVLVKFDPRRRRGAAQVIFEFARTSQVLLFSCHPEFQDIFREISRDPAHGDTTVASWQIADGAISRVF
jgi:uncharacterized protein YhaN